MKKNARKKQTSTVNSLRVNIITLPILSIEDPGTLQQELNAVFTIADSFGESTEQRGPLHCSARRGMRKKGVAAACSNTTIVELQWWIVCLFSVDLSPSKQRTCTLLCRYYLLSNKNDGKMCLACVCRVLCIVTCNSNRNSRLKNVLVSIHTLFALLTLILPHLFGNCMISIVLINALLWNTHEIISASNQYGMKELTSL